MVRLGIQPEFFSGGYNQFEQLIYGKDAALEAFEPHLTYFCVGSDHISTDLPVDDARWTKLWQSTNQFLACDVVQDVFQEPIERVYGNLERNFGDSRTSKIRKLNSLLGSCQPHFVHLHDTEHLASLVGRARWRDQKLFDISKIPVSFEFHIRYASSLASQFAGIFGRSKKCLVLDLDNTLWGGVVGDLGWQNIQHGPESPTGEAFFRFQSYLKELACRGVLLVVCSKNDESIAREVFEQRSDFALQLSDFALFVANWNPKDENIKDIASKLNIGLDSIVFVDDNPAERELLRQSLPEVSVAAMPSDPADFAICLSQYCFFECTSITSEDRMRSAEYQAQVVRKELKENANSYADYLESLEMKATFSEFNETNIDRVTQLFNKTNQFNLRTKRFTRAQIEDMLARGKTMTLTANLTDRFGDYGLVSAAIALQENSKWSLENWVMSCRVFSRQLEHLFFSELVHRLLQVNATELRTQFLATKKNHVVRELFDELGLVRTHDSPKQRDWICDQEAMRGLAHRHRATKIEVS
ncbi:HAD-IIIC family phosphatase [Roseiconus lacunae]|uniref:HAD-IIIC family phosphatase n=1 Tax=Roseiconus lacunae TaxID=2605694 RepID=UPI001E2D1EE2|nr:HAD-IIIC family phosphatase [Roseiconus lacunae]MCD0458151.1 HAD-IIIC family phosphatase [Roseiconus lacunae]